MLAALPRTSNRIDCHLAEVSSFALLGKSASCRAIDAWSSSVDRDTAAGERRRAALWMPATSAAARGNRTAIKHQGTPLTTRDVWPAQRQRSRLCHGYVVSVADDACDPNTKYQAHSTGGGCHHRKRHEESNALNPACCIAYKTSLQSHWAPFHVARGQVMCQRHVTRSTEVTPLGAECSARGVDASRLCSVSGLGGEW